MKYQWILFDADETLFSFNSYLGLHTMLKRYGIHFSPTDYEAFQAVNKPLWVAYQNKEIQAEDLQRIRFEKLAHQTGQDPLALNLELMQEMATLSLPLDNVIEMLKALHGKVRMAIITNGFNALQHKRLVHTQTEPYFEFLTVSEKIGAAKPDPMIFNAAFQEMEKCGELDKKRILMVGDTLASDVLGGNQVGIDTCWFNPHRHPNTSNIRPTYEIQSILELIAIARG
ncbi:MAG: pyrimidine 5'-nucleotidase [Pasteurellaceae bacterium]|nr:pyrimidine 5'-nucleotidase [Pasteurellaceae bacterium]